jgi:hypothetical protein
MTAAHKAVSSLVILFAACLCALDGGPVAPRASAQGPDLQAASAASLMSALGICSDHTRLAEAEAAEACTLAKNSSVSLATYGSKHFVLFCPGSDAWAQRMSGLLEKAQADFCASVRRLGLELQPPSGRLVWVCFCSTDDFDQYSRQSDQVDMSWTDGYYSARTNRVALMVPSSQAPRLGGGVELAAQAGRVAQFGPQPDGKPSGESRLDARWITHELAHQLAFNYGLQKRGVLYPLWLSEGLATNFEADNDGRFGFGRDNRPRRRTLLNSYVQGRLTSLRRFVMQERLDNSGEAQARRDYAQCWGLYRFLSQERPVQLRQYLLALRNLEVGNRDGAELRREFIDAFGPMETVEADWQNWLDELLAADQAQVAEQLP